VHLTSLVPARSRRSLCPPPSASPVLLRRPLLDPREDPGTPSRRQSAWSLSSPLFTPTHPPLLPDPCLSLCALYSLERWRVCGAHSLARCRSLLFPFQNNKSIRTHRTFLSTVSSFSPPISMSLFPSSALPLPLSIVYAPCRYCLAHSAIHPFSNLSALDEIDTIYPLYVSYRTALLSSFIELELLRGVPRCAKIETILPRSASPWLKQPRAR